METITTRQATRAGLRAVLPIVLGIAPFGFVAGIAAVEAGFGAGGAAAFSTLVFAGASQLAAIDLLVRDAPVIVVVATVLVINARLLMYSASLATALPDVPLRERLLTGYLLNDQVFALAITRYTADEARGRTTPWRVRVAFFMGAAVPLWLGWQATTLAGAFTGAVVPDAIPLDFAVPLVFAALLVPAVTDRPTLVAAVVSGAVAVLAAGLPANLGLPVGAVAGIAAGWVWGRRSRLREAVAR